jgi:hypothetical protein
MTLSDWAAQHPDEIIAEATSRAGVARLLAVVAREITDAKGVPSDDGRLEHAFAACLAIARAALAACGYRLRSSAHHFLAIESLQHTIGLTESEVTQLQRFRGMRSRAMYEKVGIVTATDAQAALAAAHRLRERLTAWLGEEHPELAKE